MRCFYCETHWRTTTVNCKNNATLQLVQQADDLESSPFSSTSQGLVNLIVQSKVVFQTVIIDLPQVCQAWIPKFTSLNPVIVTIVHFVWMSSMIHVSVRMVTCIATNVFAVQLVFAKSAQSAKFIWFLRISVVVLWFRISFNLCQLYTFPSLISTARLNLEVIVSGLVPC